MTDVVGGAVAGGRIKPKLGRDDGIMRGTMAVIALVLVLAALSVVLVLPALRGPRVR